MGKWMDGYLERLERNRLENLTGGGRERIKFLGKDILYIKDNPGHMSRAGQFYYHRAGYHVAVHTQGERAVQLVLDAAEPVLRAHPWDDHRHRLEQFVLHSRAPLHRRHENPRPRVAICNVVNPTADLDPLRFQPTNGRSGICAGDQKSNAGSPALDSGENVLNQSLRGAHVGTRLDAP